MISKYSAPDLDQLATDWHLSGKLVLPAEPLIVVAGAFEGKLIRLFTEMFPNYKRITGYEPQRGAFERCLKNVEHLPRVDVHNYGLYAGSGFQELPMGEWDTDACSLLTTDRLQGKGYFHDASMVLMGMEIDLFVMNLEGYEYVLLPYLFEKGVMQRVRQTAVQFHTKYATSDSDATLAVLDGHYERTVDSWPQWVLWTRPY